MSDPWNYLAGRWRERTWAAAIVDLHGEGVISGGARRPLARFERIATRFTAWLDRAMGRHRPSSRWPWRGLGLGVLIAPLTPEDLESWYPERRRHWLKRRRARWTR